jgi:DNA-binding NtrC family response regulator
VAYRRQIGETTAATAKVESNRIVLVGDCGGWQSEMGVFLAREGYATDRVVRLDAALPRLEGGAVRALLLASGPLAASDVLLLRRIREVAPATAIVVVTMTPTDPDIKQAFENGATAFLSWPASRAALRQAIVPAGRSPQ